MALRDERGARLLGQVPHSRTPTGAENLPGYLHREWKGISRGTRIERCRKRGVPTN